MQKNLDEITKVENDAITTFEGLVSAKEKEIAAATDAIEVKTERAGETAVQIVSLKNELEDTKDSLGADERFLMVFKKTLASPSLLQMEQQAKDVKAGHEGAQEGQG